MQLTRAEALLVLACSAFNQVPSKRIRTDIADRVETTYDIASLIDAYFREKFPGQQTMALNEHARNALLNPEGPNTTYHVQTYNPGSGHGEPLVPLVVSGGQGLTIEFPENANGDSPDLYIEHLRGQWTINFTPDNADVRVVIKMRDDSSFTVTDAYGNTVYEEDSSHQSNT